MTKPILNSRKTPPAHAPTPPDEEPQTGADEAGEVDEVDEDVRTASDLEAVFDVPVNVSAVLGRTSMEVNELLKLKDGDILDLDRKVGEAIDIYVNNRLVARGEVVVGRGQTRRHHDGNH